MDGFSGGRGSSVYSEIMTVSNCSLKKTVLIRYRAYGMAFSETELITGSENQCLAFTSYYNQKANVCWKQIDSLVAGPAIPQEDRWTAVLDDA